MDKSRSSISKTSKNIKINLKRQKPNAKRG